MKKGACNGSFFVLFGFTNYSSDKITVEIESGFTSR